MATTIKLSIKSSKYEITFAGIDSSNRFTIYAQTEGEEAVIEGEFSRYYDKNRNTRICLEDYSIECEEKVNISEKDIIEALERVDDGSLEQYLDFSMNLI